MRNLMLMSVLIAACLNAIGCCGPRGCGFAGDSCYDCEGGFGPRHVMATGPIDALRQARRSLVCGGGCGEVYYGEWVSTPPDCADPCCGSDFVGGAAKCMPFCWQPGSCLGGLYGKRFDSGCGSSCDSCSDCDSCGGGEEIIDSGSSVVDSCPTCSSKAIDHSTTQMNGQSPQRLVADQTTNTAPPQPRSAQKQPMTSGAKRYR